MVRRARLRLVGASDPTNVFDDLPGLRQEQAAPGGLQRRRRLTETFARIPHDRALKLYRQIGGSEWVLLFELDRLILKGRGRNPVKLPGPRLKAAGFTRHSRQWALQKLETAGVIRVERRGKGQSPWVTHLWFPRQD
jgi:hypothetical protein